MQLRGKLVLVTGASSGIGAATARALAREGARTVLVARGAEALERVADEIRRAGGEAHPVPADVAAPEQVSALAERVLADVGVPDALVNNAGAGRFLFLDETDPQEVVQMMAVPYFAAFYVTRAFVPAMLERGSGTVLQVNAAASVIAWPGGVGYTAARHALRGFTLALRQDLRGTGLHVSSVTLGEVSSDYFANNPGVKERIPKISRIIGTATPEAAANTIVGALRRDARDVHGPWRWRALRPLVQLVPRPFEWLMWRTGVHHPRANLRRRNAGSL